MAYQDAKLFLVAALAILAGCGGDETASLPTELSTENVYEATTDSSAPITLRIDGMTCEACAGRIEKALEAVPGVADVSVEFSLKKATVTLDAETQVQTPTLIEAVRAEGFSGSDL